MVTLIADGGSLTTARQTANYVFGSWQVSAPDGIEQIVPDETRNNGYIYRPDDAPRGRFDLAFVRQDATIELDYITANGETSGRSDVELQMEAGQERSKGRVLVEHEISASGLGRLRPGIDINLYDIVTVSFWGMLIDLPVTALDWTEDGVKIRVGGQLIHDPEMLRSLTSEVVQQLDAERRRSEKETAQLEEQAKTDRQQTQQISSTMTTVQTLQGKQETNLSITEDGLREVFHMSTDLYGYASGNLTLTGLQNQMYRRRDALGVLLLGWESTT